MNQNTKIFLLAALLGTSLAYVGSIIPNIYQERGSRERKPQEIIPIQKLSVEKKPILESPLEQKLRSFSGFEHVDQYDNLIIRAVDQVNQEFSRYSHFQPIRYDLIKSMIIEESGSPEHKETAFRYDPMQIARDFGLLVNRDGGESGFPKNGHPEFKGIKKTPRKNGRWDYSDPEGRITAELSILGGTRYLAKKTLTFDQQGSDDGTRTLKQALIEYNKSSRQERYAQRILQRLK